jgi:hypothetical protein
LPTLGTRNVGVADLGTRNVGVSDLGPDGADLQLRDILVAQIAEYARHCAHADLLRERIDGRAASKRPSPLRPRLEQAQKSVTVLAPCGIRAQR